MYSYSLISFSVVTFSGSVVTFACGEEAQDEEGEGLVNEAEDEVDKTDMPGSTTTVMADLFKADIFSLGATLLFIASGGGEIFKRANQGKEVEVEVYNSVHELE